MTRLETVDTRPLRQDLSSSLALLEGKMDQAGMNVPIPQSTLAAQPTTANLRVLEEALQVHPALVHNPHLHLSPPWIMILVQTPSIHPDFL